MAKWREDFAQRWVKHTFALLCFACAHPLVGAFDGARPVAAVCWTRSEIFLPRGGIVSVTASQGVSAVHFESPVHVFFHTKAWPSSREWARSRRATVPHKVSSYRSGNSFGSPKPIRNEARNHSQTELQSLRRLWALLKRFREHLGRSGLDFGRSRGRFKKKSRAICAQEALWSPKGGVFPDLLDRGGVPK